MNLKLKGIAGPAQICFQVMKAHVRLYSVASVDGGIFYPRTILTHKY